MIPQDWFLSRGYGRPFPAGGVHGPQPLGEPGLVLTPDSDKGGSAHLNARVLRESGKLWLPSPLLGKIYDAAIWKLDAGFSGETEGVSMSGAWEMTWQAGTKKIVQPTVSDVVENHPGWQTLAEALEGKRHLKPPPDEDEYADLLGFGGLDWTMAFSGDVPGQISISVTLGRVIPAWYASVPPTSPGRWPGHSGLEPVWWVDFDILAAAEVDGSIVSSTAIGTFEETEIGTVGSQDSEWSLELSIASTHETV